MSISRPTLSSPRFYFILTLLSSFIILTPFLIFQNTFAQGDHGRDLYAFSMSAKGALPYRDYLWVYGPLMPFYYALMFKVAGVNILSVLLGEGILKLACTLTFFLIMVLLTSPFWAFMTALFFLSTYGFFFHTYVYTGGVLLLLLTLYTLIKYIYAPHARLLYTGLCCIFLLNLVKLNMGLGVLAGYVLCIFLIDRKAGVSFQQRSLYYLSAIIGVPLLTFLTYLAMLAGLPDYVVRQCFPFSRIGAQYAPEGLQLALESIKFVLNFAGASWSHAVTITVVLATPVLFLIGFRGSTASGDPKARLALLSFFIMTLFLLQEYFVSAVPYRTMWAIPAAYLMVFTMLWFLLKPLPQPGKIALAALLGAVIFFRSDINYKNLQYHIHPQQFLAVKRGGILLGNSPEWINTVENTVRILEGSLTKDELFLALPYDPLYYFLLDRPSPTYQLVFFDYMDIPPEQDRQAVRDLEDKRVNWAIYSNRITSAELGLGAFGRTNSPELRKYLEEKFGLVRELGYWDGREPGWNNFHGIRIIQRYDPFQ